MPRPKKDGEFFNCYLRKDLMDMLNKYSEESGIPKTTIVEKALDEYLKKFKK